MPIGLRDEHEDLRRAARRFLESTCPPSVPRALLDDADEAMPPFWSGIADLGWPALHVSESHGGQGFGLLELAVVVEEMGRAIAPGPFVPTALAAALVDRFGSDDLRGELLPALVGGTAVGAVAFAGRVVPGGGLADILVVPVRGAWYALRRDAPGISVAPATSADATRRVVAVEVDTGADMPADARLEGCTDDAVRTIAAAVLAAEAAGGAAWCLETASDHAKVREQFGRPIGQFQAVKHRCADMLVAVEQAVGAAWDAARAIDAHGPEADEARLAAAAAAAVAPEAFVRCAKDAVQILGGVGFTWEHDAHLYLKRAMAVRQLLAGPVPWRAQVARLAVAGTRRRLGVDLPPEAEPFRAEVRALVEELRGLERPEQRRRLVDGGWFVPHWPVPWGRSASPLEQLVIDAELRAARIRRPNLAVGAWAAPTIVAHGTIEQQERWVRPTLYGEIAWCQLFSEPGAGSDLAALATKAVRTHGGWSLSGQKVWTSLAREADWGICLARTNPNVAKHLGITYFVVDMRTDGLDIRPLRELTGQAMFNEVFLDDVFVPDDCVIGEVDGGWPLARTTLANERVAMADGSSFGGGVEALLSLAADRSAVDDPVALDRVGALVVEAHTVSVLGLRTTLRALAGARPGSESSVRKLLSVEHDQRVQELGVELLGTEGATLDGVAAGWNFGFLANRCLTIAGGTSEVQRNVIAERLLGLPRDP